MPVEPAGDGERLPALARAGLGGYGDPRVFGARPVSGRSAVRAAGSAWKRDVRAGPHRGKKASGAVAHLALPPVLRDYFRRVRAGIQLRGVYLPGVLIAAESGGERREPLTPML